MPSLNLKTLIGRNPSRPSLKDRAATLKAGLARFARRKPDAAVAPSAPAVSALDDSALFALEAEFHAADAVVLAAYEALNEARGRYAEPDMPIELNPWRGDWMRTAIPRTRTEPVGDGKFRSLPYGAEEVEQLRERRCMRHSYGNDGELQPDGRRMVPDVKVQERVDGIVAAWDRWQAEIVAAKVAAGTPAGKIALRGAKEARSSLLERIRDTPARALAGLGVKARIAASMNAVEDMKEEAREYDPDQPEALPYDIAGDVLAIVAGGEFASPDAALLDLGQQFQASFEQELEACARVNAIQTAANELLPDRPDSLYFRASDEPFCLHSEGRGFQDDGAIRQADIEWMTRRPCQREVWRDVRDGERGWDMVPGKVPEMQLWPEAQARVDEIVAAWSVYQAEILTVQAESGADEANEIADRHGDQSEALALRIAELPASTAEGMRVKLRVLHRYAPLREREDLEDPETPVLRSLFRDAGV